MLASCRWNPASSPLKKAGVQAFWSDFLCSSDCWWRRPGLPENFPMWMRSSAGLLRPKKMESLSSRLNSGFLGSLSNFYR